MEKMNKNQEELTELLWKSFVRLEDVELDVLKIKDILNTTCQECKQPDDVTCHYTCFILAHAIAQASKEIIKTKEA